MLRAYMQDPITVIFDEGEADWGEPNPTTDVEMKAYIDWKTHLVSNIAGEQVIASPQISSGIVYIMYSRKLTHKDFIKINNIRYAILDVRDGKDFSKNHQEIHLA